MMTRISEDCKEFLFFPSAAKITLNFSTFEQLYNAIENNKSLDLNDLQILQMARQEEL